MRKIEPEPAELASQLCAEAPKAGTPQHGVALVTGAAGCERNVQTHIGMYSKMCITHDYEEEPKQTTLNALHWKSIQWFDNYL